MGIIVKREKPAASRKKKEVYAWHPYSDKDGLNIGGQDPDVCIVESVFEEGLPIEDAIKEWRTYKGVQSAMKGDTSGIRGQDWVDEVRRTLQWMTDRYPLKYRTPVPLEELAQYDIIDLSLSVPFVNKRVIHIFDRLCPNDYEAFPVELMTMTGYTNQYYLINITHCVKGAVDEEKSHFETQKWEKAGDKGSIGDLTRLVLKKGCMGSHKLARIYEDNTKEMVHEDIITAFKSENIKGMSYQYLEDKVNAIFTKNYLPDGTLI